MNMNPPSEYAPTTAPGSISTGALIDIIDEGSPADRAGLKPGKIITKVDGQPLRDIIDWLWLTDAEKIQLSVCQGDGDGTGRSDFVPLTHVTLQRDFGESWGITFSDVLFDGLKTCCNSCVFCFMSMLPKGMRPSLYVRDDDYRLSFLQGNFVTLTNMSEEDVQRVIDYHLSPLHVSLHAIDPELRKRLIGKNHAHGIEVLEQLLLAGIEIHAQIVLVPGENDGAQLDTTLEWIEQHPGIRSVGIVPYGFTKYANIQESFDAEQVQALITQVAPYQQRSLAANGTTRFQLADEWFLRAGLSVPEAEYYDDFPQFDNGIGMLRSSIDDWVVYYSGHLEPINQVTLALQTSGTTSILVTGEAFAPTLRQLAQELPLEVVAIKNEFFGGNVTVAGLLTAKDIVEQLAESHLPQDTTVIIPDVIFNADGLTLDDRRIEDIRQGLGCKVVVVPCRVKA